MKERKLTQSSTMLAYPRRCKNPRALTSWPDLLYTTEQLTIHLDWQREGAWTDFLAYKPLFHLKDLCNVITALEAQFSQYEVETRPY